MAEGVKPGTAAATKRTDVLPSPSTATGKGALIDLHSAPSPSKDLTPQFKLTVSPGSERTNALSPISGGGTTAGAPRWPFAIEEVETAFDRRLMAVASLEKDSPKQLEPVATPSKTDLECSDILEDTGGISAASGGTGVHVRMDDGVTDVADSTNKARASKLRADPSPSSKGKAKTNWAALREVLGAPFKSLRTIDCSPDGDTSASGGHIGGGSHALSPGLISPELPQAAAQATSGLWVEGNTAASPVGAGVATGTSTAGRDSAPGTTKRSSSLASNVLHDGDSNGSTIADLSPATAATSRSRVAAVAPYHVQAAALEDKKVPSETSPGFMMRLSGWSLLGGGGGNRGASSEMAAEVAGQQNESSALEIPSPRSDHVGQGEAPTSNPLELSDRTGSARHSARRADREAVVVAAAKEKAAREAAAAAAAQQAARRTAAQAAAAEVVAAAARVKGAGDTTPPAGFSAGITSESQDADRPPWNDRACFQKYNSPGALAAAAAAAARISNAAIAAEVGGRAVDQAAEVGGGAVDQAAEVGGRAVDQAAEVGGGAVDQAAEVGGGAVDQAAEVGGGAVDQAAVPPTPNRILFTAIDRLKETEERLRAALAPSPTTGDIRGRATETETAAATAGTAAAAATTATTTVMSAMVETTEARSSPVDRATVASVPTEMEAAPAAPSTSPGLVVLRLSLWVALTASLVLCALLLQGVIYAQLSPDDWSALVSEAFNAPADGKGSAGAALVLATEGVLAALRASPLSWGLLGTTTSACCAAATAVFVAGPAADGVAGNLRIRSLHRDGGGGRRIAATPWAIGGAFTLGALGWGAYITGWMVPAFHYLVTMPRQIPTGFGGFMGWLLVVMGLREAAQPMLPLGGFLEAVAEWVTRLSSGARAGVGAEVGTGAGAEALMEATRRLLSASPRTLVQEVWAAAGRAGADITSTWLAIHPSTGSSGFGGGGGGGGSWTSTGDGSGGGGGGGAINMLLRTSSTSGWLQLVFATTVMCSLSLWYVHAAVGRRRTLFAAVAWPLVSPGTAVAAALFALPGTLKNKLPFGV
jgi:hypothetical protein